MKRRTRCALVLIAAVSAISPGAARAEAYKLDDTHTSIIFGISHLGYSFTYGRFNKASGEFSVDAANPAASKFKFAIDAASIDTNNANRDTHLKNADFLNTGEFPVITFESTKVAARQEGDKTVYEVTGNMTMHGVTKELTLPMVKLGEGQGPGGRDYRIGFHCDTKLMRSEFGMTNMLPGVGDEIAITISFEGIRQ